ncbi:hypothetical protein SAMN04487848_2424 [Microbacterium sp. ru370.1]|uniref:hypothetical protein n=1 Tax=unclassified Microbacterium TaxID=2609290 RepID=UPI00087EC92A|nr:MULTISPECIES: hypothetical protein [unclassified Microbacterium]SDO84765.1 hypothetical protein SAMN04487848_2424 [Microbacterium sp. ru370.1]SIT90469.1 hypothetical protein SAMN05880579_2419 [Microbacterium sp. RU1D]
MTPAATVVARYDAVKRAAVEQTLRKVVRGQGVAALALAVLWGFVTLLPIVAVAADGQGAAALLLALTLAVPLAIGALGVRQLRRRPRMPEVAVAITPTTVQFPALERPSAFAPAVRAEEWPREGTLAEIRPASGLLQTALVVFTRQDGRKRRRRTVSAENLDIDPRNLVDALGGPQPT